MGEFSFRSNIKRLVTHGMQGFDYEKARNDLEIPDNYDVMAMIAIGKKKKRPKDNLPQLLQERDYLLNHLLIVPVKNKNEKEKNNEKYELSLLGVLLVLAIISLQRRNEDNMNFNYYKSNYYDIAASNYREKLPTYF